MDQKTTTNRPNNLGRSLDHEKLEIFIGKWINVGFTIEADGRKGLDIVTSDVYEWMPGGFFVLHTAYGRVGDMDGGGTEILAYEPALKRYSSRFFDSNGHIHQATLTADGDNWTWKGDTTRCTAVFSADGRVQTAHHVRLDEHGKWIPAMEVVLRKVVGK